MGGLCGRWGELLPGAEPEQPGVQCPGWAPGMGSLMERIQPHGAAALSPILPRQGEKQLHVVP